MAFIYLDKAESAKAESLDSERKPATASENGT